MARDDEQQAMTSERLAEIRQTIDILMTEPPSSTEFLAAELLAEVERLRTREAALLAMLQRLIRDADATYVDVHPYAGIGHTKIVGPFPSTLEQARALLASAGERSGGDGQQPEQATCPVCGMPGRRVTSRWWCDGCNLPFRRPGEAAGEE